MLSLGRGKKGSSEVPVPAPRVQGSLVLGRHGHGRLYPVFLPDSTFISLPSLGCVVWQGPPLKTFPLPFQMVLEGFGTGKG